MKSSRKTSGVATTPDVEEVAVTTTKRSAWIKIKPALNGG